MQEGKLAKINYNERYHSNYWVSNTKKVEFVDIVFKNFIYDH